MKSQLLYKIALGTMSICTLISCQNKKIKNSTLITQVDSVKSTASPQEERGWEEVEKNIRTFYEAGENDDKYYNGKFWYSRQVEERYFNRVSRSISSFLREYPNSKYYFDALEQYFLVGVQPRFLFNELSREEKSILDRKTEKGEDYQTDLNNQFRALPYDISSRDKWLREGDSLANKFLQSNAPTDQKVRIEIGVLTRDILMGQALLQNSRQQYSELQWPKVESDFWFLFDRHFWKEYQEDMDRLIYKYPDFPEWPDYVNRFIKIPTKNFLSPQLTEYFWEHFYALTNRPEMFKKHPVIKKINQKAMETLKALEELKTFDETQPLQMQMTDMDGKEINLKDYRGKVVMLDFWDLRCAPCIKEMPHVQALYEKYKDQGFEVIGICAAGDKNKGRIQEIINKQGATWPQVLDNSKTAIVNYHSLYKIQRLPTVWLLNKDGIIVDKNARGNRLEPLIQKYIR